ncbi:polysaccharide lyase family 8 super-sandwich domain-containing protein [Streptacidiphilus fuscans]|uniref:Polysaccharide lyase 8 family protein n=1 Tax=Streptacidiphilus fuscans TaxID=2789292 RepID=A0A931B3H2_9ACTN|nr:polysaccharide lyase family 8 super-sandwich domain-containing protein [Streptacidiphilus fuscans]MBF9069669.1 polysaccharide lyase 8 family protein [Streptacidiphilus fuscans]
MSTIRGIPDATEAHVRHSPDRRRPSFALPPLPALTRRRLLQLGGVGLGALALPLGAASSVAAATDPYAALRSAWTGYLTGGVTDTSGSVYAPAITGLNAEAAAFLASIQTGSGRTSLWSDLPLGSVSANMTTTFSRLKTLALAWAIPGTDYTGSASLAATVASALDFMTSSVYAPGITPYNNWWDWQIGSSQALEDIGVLMYSQLTSTQVAACCAAIDTYVSDPTKQLIVPSSSTTSTGANRLDECRAVIVRGALGSDPTAIATGVADLSPALPLVMYGDGLYADGSYQQHSGVAYTGTYGEIYFADVVALVLLLQGSQWAITDPNLANLFTGVADGFAPMVHNGLMLDSVRGRAVSRFNESDADDGFTAALTLLRYAEATTDANLAATWRATAKGWLQRNTVSTIASTTQSIVDYTTGQTVTTSTAGVAGIALAQSVLADSSVPAAPEPQTHRQFPDMARAVHRRPGWAYSLSLCSREITRYEVINGENLHGWFTGDGMGQLHLDTDVAQFNDAYWDTADLYQLPGTTADQGALANSAGQNTKPSTSWVGGSVLSGDYGTVGMQLQAASTNLTAVKSWFCLDDSVVCLGAGITSTSGNHVVTTVENRNLHTGGSATLSVNGNSQATSPGWTSTVSGVHWASISGVGGYCFLWPSGANNVVLADSSRTGNWTDVNALAPTTLASDTRPYLSVALDHGASPTGATYSYVLLPTFTEAQTAAYAAAPPVSVLSNTPTVQAVTDSALGVTMANFFAAGTAGPITVDAPASVSMQTATQAGGGQLTVAVSDPSRAAATVHVTVAASGYTSFVSADPTVTVLAVGGGTVELLVETGGSRGGTHSVTLATSGTALTPASGSLLPATADTYVRDGSYASTNYGTSTTLQVKNANASNTGYDRIALLKFDTTGVSGTVARAVLWLNGSVQDSGGNQTTLQAFATSADSWSETGTTWDNAPSRGTALGTGALSSTADWVGLDVTSAVAASLTGAGGDGTASLAVWEPTGVTGLAVVLNSRENSANPPVLEVVTR